MIIRNKTKRRLVILLGCSAAFIVLVTAAVVLRQLQLNQRLQEHKRLGTAALEAKDYQSALINLGRYIQKNPNDIDTVYLYAQARLNVEEPNGQHIVDGLYFLRRVVDAKPQLVEAAHLLLSIYGEVGFNVETVQEAKNILSHNPNDVEVIRAKVLALGRMGRFEEGLVDAELGCKLAPLDIDTQILALLMLHKLNRPAAEILARADALRKAHPDDPRFQLIQGIAYRIVDDSENAMAWLREAAATPSKDGNFLRMLVTQFDNTGKFEESLKLMQKAAEQSPDDVKIQRAYLERLWFHNLVPQVLEKSSKLDPANPATDRQMMALRALALIQTNQADAAKPIVASMRKRSTDRIAQIWADVIDALMSPSTISPTKLLALATNAVNRDSRNPLFHMLQGDTYLSMNENILAMTSWREAARSAPSWGLPHARLAKTLLLMNQDPQALQEAYQAISRQSNDLETIITFIQATAANLDVNKSGQVERLLAMIEQVQVAAPGEPTTLLVQVQTLATISETDRAREVLKQVIHNEKTKSASLFTRAAALSQRFKLGLEDECLAAQEKQFGLTPEVANLRVKAMIKTEPKQALEAFDKMMGSVKNAAGDANWMLARANLLDATGDANASKYWGEVLEKFPDNRRVLMDAVGAPGVLAQRALADKAIDQLRQVSGDQSVAWRLARARYEMQAPTGSRNYTQTAQLLSDVLRVSPNLMEVRLLLAQCYEAMGNITGALEQYTICSEMDPDSVTIKVQLTRLQQARGEFDKASLQLQSMTGNRELTSAEKQQIAMLLTRQGQVGKAIAMLESKLDDSSQSNLILADLYLRRGDVARAETLARKLVEKTPELSSVRFLATLLASQGRTEDARKVLDILEKLDLPPGSKEMALGDFQIRFQQVDKAIESYKAAAKAGPTNVTAWERLIACALYQGDVERATQIAAEANKALPDNSSFSMILGNADLIRSVKNVDDCRTIIYALVDDPEYRDAALNVLRLYQARLNNSGSPADFLIRLRQLSDKNPRFLALQILTAQIYSQSGRTEDAIALSMRTMQVFPTAIVPAQRSAELLASVGRWAEVLSTARVWRQRVTGQTLAPDLLISQAYRMTGDPKSAIKHLQPYVNQPNQDPAVRLTVNSNIAASLVAMGQLDKASAALFGELKDSASARQNWIRLAPSVPNPGAWLDQVATQIPPDNLDELAALAMAWEGIRNIKNNPAFHANAKQIISELVTKPKASAYVFYAAAALALADNDMKSAENFYRKSLALLPEQPEVLNNMGILILRNGGDPKEALKFAKQAVTSQPWIATFYDSLSTVQLALKDFDGATESMREAVRLEPNVGIWRINLVMIMLDAKKNDEAQRSLLELDELMPSMNLRPTDKEKLKVVRERIDQLNKTK